MPVLFAALFLFGVISALFGPIKYGILPDHLAENELPAGNALVEGATFIAILIGTIVGGLASKGGGDPASFAGMMMAFALACWIAALFIPATGEGAPNLVIDFNIARSTVVVLRDLYRQKRLWWGALVVSWFWLVGAVVLSLLPPLVKNALGGSRRSSPPISPSSRSPSRSARALPPGSPAGASSSSPRSSAACCSACSRSISAGSPWG